MDGAGDDDAPEELTLGQGRDNAELTRKQQSENQKRLASEEKSRRRKRNEQNREAKLKKQKKEEDKQAIEDDDFTVSTKASGFLDESIVQFLVAKERNQTAPTSESEKKPEPKTKRKKKKTSDSSIKLLNQNQAPKQTAGIEFLKRRLYGSHVVRSKDMIPRPVADRPSSIAL